MSISSIPSSLMALFPATASASGQTGSTSTDTSSTGGTASSLTSSPDGTGALMATVASTPAIASSTGTNWLSEAQSAIQASDGSGGMMGALQSSSLDSQPGSIASFLAQSQATANNLATIMQTSIQNQNELYDQISQNEGQQAAEQRFEQENALVNPPAQTNYTPPAELPPVEYYDDGSSLDTKSNILTMPDGKQFDVTTGLPYIDPTSLVSLANGAYLNTSTNTITEANGTQIDATTGITLSTTA